MSAKSPKPAPAGQPDPQTMSDVRAEVDRLDREIVERLALRFEMMAHAARIKPDRSVVRDEVRKADVLAKVRASAQAAGAPDDRIARLYDALIESSIAYEYEVYDRLKGGR
ncbi:MAG: chorismate mutase [Rhodothalassiaceae bacterium]